MAKGVDYALAEERFTDPKCWTLVVDARITRRKYYHFIVSPEGRVRFRSMFLWECIEYARSEAISALRLLPTISNDTSEPSAAHIALE